VRAYVFAGCGLGKDRGDLDGAGRADFRAAAWKQARMEKYVYSPGAAAVPHTPEEAWSRLSWVLGAHLDWSHRLILDPGPCFPNPRRLDALRFKPEEFEPIRELVIAYASWITSEVRRMDADPSGTPSPFGRFIRFPDTRVTERSPSDR
jgi:hypothetical protein